MRLHWTLLGGSLAQPLRRHKSRKASYQAAFQVAAAVNVAGLIALVVFGDDLQRVLAPR